jgi:hypothetical protein
MKKIIVTLSITGLALATLGYHNYTQAHDAENTRIKNYCTWFYNIDPICKDVTP